MQVPAPSFTQLHAALHLAHKHQRCNVKMRALFALKKSCTPGFTQLQYDTFNGVETAFLPVPRPGDSVAVAAVNIARLTQTSPILPYALHGRPGSRETCWTAARGVTGPSSIFPWKTHGCAWTRAGAREHGQVCYSPSPAASALEIGERNLGRDWVPGFTKRTDGKNDPWTRYILDLFPELDAGESL